MTRYVLTHDEPYEGKHDLVVGAMEEIKDWFRDPHNMSRFELYPDEYDIHVDEGPSVYEVARQVRAEKRDRCCSFQR